MRRPKVKDYVIKSIGVYKTNVCDRGAAKRIIEEIRSCLPDCKASFDLENFDKVLRVESDSVGFNEVVLMMIVENYGYHIEVLP